MSTDPIATAPRPSLASTEGWSIRRAFSADWTSAVPALVFVLGVAGYFHPNFLAPGQLINVVQSAVYAALIAAGLVFLIPQNEIDLSAGGTYILTGIVAALLMRAGMNPTLAIPLSLVVTLPVWLLNVLTSQVIGMPSLIGTLAMSRMLRGLSLALANGTQVTGVPLDDPLIAVPGGGRIWGLPVSVVLLIVVGILLSVLMHKTPFGHRVRQIGSNPDAAAFSGIPSRQTKTLGFVVAALMAGVVGIVALNWADTILDNLATHKSLKSADLLKRQKCWFLFLPAYSPDLNPIEMAFSKLKAHLRRLEARTYDQLIQALGDICGLYNPDECCNFFNAAGYASD